MTGQVERVYGSCALEELQIKKTLTWHSRLTSLSISEAMQSKQRAPLSPPHEHLAPSVSLCSSPSPSLFCFFCSYFSFLFVCFSGLLFRHPGSKADEPSPPAVTWSPDKGPALIDQNVVCPTMDMSSWRLAITEFLSRVSNEAPKQQVVRS